MLNLGNNSPINKVYLGSTTINKAYLGSTLVYESTDSFSPTDISNCYLWLDADQESYADNALVSSVTDRSGNGRDFTASNSVRFRTSEINGKHAFNLTAKASTIESDSASSIWKFLHNSNSTVFMVAKVNTVPTNGLAFLWRTSSGSSGTPGVFFITDNRAASSYFSGVLQGIQNASSRIEEIRVNSQFDYSNYEIYRCWGDASSSGNTITLQNGNRTALTDTLSSSPSSANPNSTLRIAGDDGGVFSRFQVHYVCEFIIYNKVLSSVERGQVNDYLEAKYNL